jgi:hypothetical protein
VLAIGVGVSGFVDPALADEPPLEHAESSAARVPAKVVIAAALIAAALIELMRLRIAPVSQRTLAGAPRETTP